MSRRYKTHRRLRLRIIFSNIQKLKSMWFDITKNPPPTRGKIVVHVDRKWGEPAQFSDVVNCDEIGLLDNTGDEYIYKNDITYWCHLPKFHYCGIFASDILPTFCMNKLTDNPVRYNRKKTAERLKKSY
jgi:hypothetical protein